MGDDLAWGDDLFRDTGLCGRSKRFCPTLQATRMRKSLALALLVPLGELAIARNQSRARTGTDEILFMKYSFQQNFLVLRWGQLCWQRQHVTPHGNSLTTSAATCSNDKQVRSLVGSGTSVKLSRTARNAIFDKLQTTGRLCTPPPPKKKVHVL